MNLAQLAKQINDSIATQSGSKLASLLRVSSPSKLMLAKDIEKLGDVDGWCDQKFNPPYNEVIAAHFKTITKYSRSAHIEAYQQHSNTLNSFLKAFQAESNWSLDVLRRLCIDLRILAASADKQLKSENKKPEKLEDAARTLTKCFQLTITDRSPLESSKKWGALDVITNLFKLYFKMNNLRMCKNLTKHVDSGNFPPLDQFTMYSQVTYRYYVGRLELFDGQHEKASAALTFAFERCTKKSRKNKRLALLFLLPVRLVTGLELPKPQLLRKYRLEPFAGLVEALKRGDVAGLNNTLATNQNFFIKTGVYLILQRLQFACYRRLFKKVQRALNINKIPLTTFVAAVRMQGIEIDSAEVACILANLIFNGQVRGYIAHKPQVLVLSKDNPFPRVDAKARATMDGAE